jgi:hypothetical protein
MFFRHFLLKCVYYRVIINPLNSINTYVLTHNHAGIDGSEFLSEHADLLG